MQKVLAWSVLGVLLFVSLGSADLVTPRKLSRPEPVFGMSIHATIDQYRGGELASVIISGDGITCLGLYVFDKNGNCVARDDAPTPFGSDDLAVEWLPPDTASYSVEVRNAGLSMIGFDFAVR